MLCVNVYRELRPMFRILVAMLCVCLLEACSPSFDWRQVDFGQRGASGVLPDSPQTQTHQVAYETWTLPLSMTSARAGSVLFALGSAPLPPDLSASSSERERLARWAIKSFYQNAGAELPDPAPGPGERFTVHGQGPSGAVVIEAQVRVTDVEWLEAVVIAAPEDYAQAPVGDFWFSLRWPVSTPSGSGRRVPPGPARMVAANPSASQQ